MTQEVSKTQQYDASNIQVLEGLEAVRKRPGIFTINNAKIRIGDKNDARSIENTTV